MLLPLRWLLLICLLLAAPSGVARADMEVYHPKHRLAEDLVPLVEVALSDGGRVAAGQLRPEGLTGVLARCDQLAKSSVVLGLVRHSSCPMNSLEIHLRTECQPENIVRPISCPLVRVNVALLSSRARNPQVAPPTRRDSNQPCRLVEVRVPS